MMAKLQSTHKLSRENIRERHTAVAGDSRCLFISSWKVCTYIGGHLCVFAVLKFPAPVSVATDIDEANRVRKVMGPPNT